MMYKKKKTTHMILSDSILSKFANWYVTRPEAECASKNIFYSFGVTTEKKKNFQCAEETATSECNGSNSIADEERSVSNPEFTVVLDF